MVDEKGFLVNLNADPALNELLVYYLKVLHKRSRNCTGHRPVCSAEARPVLVCPQEHTRVGSADSQDIQLCGMAIQAQHCIIDVTESNGVVLSPLHNARCVQSSQHRKEKKKSSRVSEAGFKISGIHPVEHT